MYHKSDRAQARNGRARHPEPKPLTDLECARWAWRVARTREQPPPDVADRMSPEWGDCCEVVVTDGADGFKVWLRSMKQRLRAEPVRFDAMQAALKEAEVGEPEDEADAEPEARPFRLEIIGATELNRAVYRLDWYIRRILVADQPCLVGAPKKSMKTSTMADLAVSLASGNPFFGKFEVPDPVPVLILSGESGGFVVKDTILRVCRSKGIDLENLEGRLFVGYQLPQLAVQEQLDELALTIQERGIKVLVIDPLYLCLLGGSPGKRLDASNLFDMGPLLLAISRTCLDAGATPLLVHHFKKNGADPYELPELEELAYAGIQEFARQWILLKRRERFEPGSGLHKLWMVVGGSAGHSGEWALDVNEGVMDEDFRGREWSVSVESASDVRTKKSEQTKAEKVEKDAEKSRVKDEVKVRLQCQDAETALDMLRRKGPATKTAWRDEFMGWNSARFGPVFERLRDAGRIRSAEVTARTGRGERTVEGWEANPDFVFSPTEDTPW